jgi:hypothetical protein
MSDYPQGRAARKMMFRTGGPTGPEFPHWHIWRGVCGLLYARRLRTSPPIVVRADSEVDLRDQIRRVEGRMA